MDFTFSEEHEMVRQMVRDFVTKEVKPLAAKIDKDGVIPEPLIARAKELGLFGIAFPEKYGGAGAGETGYCIMLEELGHGCNSLAGLIGAHESIATSSIYLAGTEEQKQRFLPPMCRGEKIGAYALTEPSGGTDAAALRTTADRDGNGWVINGDKMWITNADIADVIVVFAITDRNLRAHGGVSAFILEKGMPGLKIGTVDEKMGLRAMHSPQIFMDNVRVPDVNRLGDLGKGFNVAMMALDVGRLSLGAGCIGASKEMLDISIQYAQQRIAFGKPIGEHEAVQIMLAEMSGDIYAMESMVYRAAWMCDQGQRFSREAAIVKYFCTEALGRIIDSALQIHGGMGYMCELPIERFYRDARVNRIFEGTNEIQRVVIARDLMKKGRY